MSLDEKKQLELDEVLGDLKADLIQLKVNPDNAKVLSSILTDLNNLFSDVTCKDIIFTDNTDKMFFGINVMPIFSTPQQIVDIVMNDQNFKINLYKVELDSKLFSSALMLNIDEIMSLLIHEIAVLTLNDAPARRARYFIDTYLTENDETIKISDYISYIELLGFGIKMAMHKTISIFSDNKENSCAMDDALELTPFITSAMGKLENKGYLWDKNVNSGFIIIEWVLRLYKDILKYRIPALHTLKKALDYTGSVYDRREIENVIMRLNRIDDESLIHESTSPKKSLLEAVLKESDDPTRFEDDFNMMRAEALASKTKEDLVDILHKSNIGMARIDNYLESKQVDKTTGKKLSKVYNNFNKVRKTLVKKIPRLG